MSCRGRGVGWPGNRCVQALGPDASRTSCVGRVGEPCSRLHRAQLAVRLEQVRARAAWGERGERRGKEAGGGWQGERAGREGGAARRCGQAGRRRASSFRIVASAVCFSRSSSAMRFRCSSARRRWRSRRRASGSRGSGCAFGLPSLGTERHPPVGRAAAAGGHPGPLRRRGGGACLPARPTRALASRAPPPRLLLLMHRIEPLQYHRLQTLDPVADQSRLWFASACRSGEGGARDVGVGSDVGRDPNAPAARRSPPAAPPTCRSAAPCGRCFPPSRPAPRGARPPFLKPLDQLLPRVPHVFPARALVLLLVEFHRDDDVDFDAAVAAGAPPRLNPNSLPSTEPRRRSTSMFAVDGGGAPRRRRRRRRALSH